MKLFSKLQAGGKQLLLDIFRFSSPRGLPGKTRRLQFILLGAALLIIAIVLGSAFRERRKLYIYKTQQTPQPTGAANLEVKDVFYSNTNKNNEKEWELRADKAQYFKNKKLVILDTIEVTFYRSNGTVYRLTGKHGQLNIETQNIMVRGDVRGTMPENTRFATESFSYDNNKRIVTTPDKVFITRDKFSMEGEGMIIDMNDEKLTILKNVKAAENK